MKIKSIKIFLKGKELVCVSAILGVLALSTLGIIAYAKIDNQLRENSDTSRTVILDPGHGGEDGGAVGVDGIVEKNINLSVALKLRDLLQVAGYNVIMTREKDEAIYDDTAKTLREKKKSDLRQRAGIIKQNCDEKNVFVSIHQNKFPNPKYCGTQIFYSKNSPLSDDLALSIKNSVTGLIQPENKREIKPADSRIFLLNGAEIPAVVVECGFLSNESEAKKLADDNYQNDMAFCIYCGIMDYFANSSN